MSIRRNIDEHWRSWSTTRRLVTWLAAFVLVMLVTIVVVQKAEAMPACGQGGDGPCWTPKQAAKKFRHGYFHRTNGFHPKAYFKNPKTFRKMAHHKIVVFLHNHPKIEAEQRNRFARSTTGCTDNCLAWQMYGDLVAKSNCGPTPFIGYDPSTCQPPTTGHQKAVVRGITVAYCGGAIILGAVGVFSTDGAAAPVAASVYGGIGCGWGFASSFLN